MKNIIPILIISFLASSFTFENEPSQPIGDGSNYHVMALSGLKMRDLPSLKGKKILTIPYNGEVELIHTGEGYGELTIQELKDFYIKGEWVKVRYDGKEGFIFNGYLTQFPLPKKFLKNDYDNYSSDFEIYLDTKFTQKDEKFNIILDDECGDTEECKCGFSKEYHENILYIYSSCYYADDVDIDLEIEGISLAEAYFITKAIDFQDSNGKDYNSFYLKTGKRLVIRDNGEGCTIFIKQRKRNSVSIKMYCEGGC